MKRHLPSEWAHLVPAHFAGAVSDADPDLRHLRRSHHGQQPKPGPGQHHLGGQSSVRGHCQQEPGWSRVLVPNQGEGIGVFCAVIFMSCLEQKRTNSSKKTFSTTARCTAATQLLVWARGGTHYFQAPTLPHTVLLKKWWILPWPVVPLSATVRGAAGYRRQARGRPPQHQAGDLRAQPPRPEAAVWNRQREETGKGRGNAKTWLFLWPSLGCPAKSSKWK